MPSSTKKQHNFMAALANNPSFAKKVGIPQSVGKDFNEADKGRKFGRGGKINIQDTQHGKLDMPFKQLNRMAGKKGGGSVRKFATGGPTKEQLAASGFDNLQDYLNDSLGKTRRGATAEQNAEIAAKARSRRAELARTPEERKAISDRIAPGAEEARRRGFSSDSPPGAYESFVGPAAIRKEKNFLDQGPIKNFNDAMKIKKGGSVKESKAMVAKEMMFMKKKGAPASMMGMKHGGMHKMPDGKMMKDSAMKKMNMGGMSKYAKGGGIESRGKTQGTVIKMATGGSVSTRADGIAQRGKTKFTNY